MLIGHLVTPEMKALAKMYLVIDKPKKMFISSEYVVYTDEKEAAVLKETVEKDGTFIDLRILLPKDSKLTTKVTHGKGVVKSNKDENKGTTFSISGIKQRTDFIKWQLLDNQGKVVKEQLLAFLLVSAKPHMVEYLVEPSVVDPNSK